jgi:hypothetical protein
MAAELLPGKKPAVARVMLKKSSSRICMRVFHTFAIENTATKSVSRRFRSKTIKKEMLK